MALVGEQAGYEPLQLRRGRRGGRGVAHALQPRCLVQQLEGEESTSARAHSKGRVHNDNFQLAGSCTKFSPDERVKQYELSGYKDEHTKQEVAL